MRVLCSSSHGTQSLHAHWQCHLDRAGLYIYISILFHQGKAWAGSEQGQGDLHTLGAEEGSPGLACGLQAPSRILGEATGRDKNLGAPVHRVAKSWTRLK